MYSLSRMQGEIITCKAAVAWKAKAPVEVTNIQVSPPGPGEVRLRVIANSLCHSDLYILGGLAQFGKFPCILGHEATGVVESIGEGVTSVDVGDAVMPCFIPECKKEDCIFCQSSKTNMCPINGMTITQGVMPDGSTRFSKDGITIYHTLGCSTFSEYTVIPEVNIAKINPKANLHEVCPLSCGVSTGWGAVFNTCKVEPNSSVAVFGIGTLGLAVIQAAKFKGARQIIAIDINNRKFQLAKQFGATDCVNAMEVEGGDVKKWLLAKEKWGYDYTFDCTGNVNVMRQALEIAHRGWGESCIIGLNLHEEISTRPFQLVTGRQWKGTFFGDWKSRTELPKLVQTVMRGEMDIKPYITHTFDGLENVNKAIELLQAGESLRAIINISVSPYEPQKLVKTLTNVRLERGWLKQLSHWSQCCNCEMKFSVFLPDPQSRTCPLPPVLYYLSGRTDTIENAKTMTGFAKKASEVALALVFPDKSPKEIERDGQDESDDFSAESGFYVNASTEKWSKHHKMYDYITKELPELVASLFPVDSAKMSITGHDMGGHGALICHLKNPGKYTSISAFAPICNPTACSWGEKAFTTYLGSVDAGKAYDATELMKTYSGPKPPILVDQGTADVHLAIQLMPGKLATAAAENGYPCELRMRPMYDHGCFFISSIINDHMVHHATALGLKRKCTQLI